MFNDKNFKRNQIENIVLGGIIAVVMLIIFLFTSCNSKSKIVEQEKEAKRQISLVDAYISDLNFKK